MLDHPQPAVPEQLGELNGVYAPPERLGGEGVPEEVRVDPAALVSRGVV